MKPINYVIFYLRQTLLVSSTVKIMKTYFTDSKNKFFHTLTSEIGDFLKEQLFPRKQ